MIIFGTQSGKKNSDDFHLFLMEIFGPVILTQYFEEKLRSSAFFRP